MSLYNSIQPKRPMRQAGNLSYLDFIRVIERIWAEAFPTIPFLASGISVDGRYPCIVYSLVNRTTHPNEVKPKQRELVKDENHETTAMVFGQRFFNYVKFTAIDRSESDGAQVVEELIEQFEDFMIRYTPIFSKLGISDLVYERRMPDDEESRDGEGVVKRSVVYRVTTEKLSYVTVENLEKVWLNITLGSVVEKDCEDEATADDADVNFGYKLLKPPE